MKLVQAEIDANPMATPAAAPPSDGHIQKNSGVAVLDLTNAADVENNFWVWVRAVRSEDAWLAKYTTIESLGNNTGIQDSLENGWYKAYVQQRGGRKLMLKVQLPPQPESRAGVYDLVVTVQAQIPLRVGNEEQTTFEFPFRVAVRPFQSWSLAVEPAEVPVRLFKRKAMLWATVENSSNDWLYVDLRLPSESGNLSYERDTERISVPPAHSVKSPSVRRVPVRVRSKYRNLLGSSIKVSVPLQAVRIDAPSVARFPSNAETTVPSLSLSSPVLIEPTTETKSAANANVAYYPPIPATLTDFVKSVRTNLMSLLGLVLMGTAAFYAASFLYEHAVHRLDQSRIRVDEPTVPPDGSVRLTGQYLKGCDISVQAGDRELPIKVDSVKDSEAKFHILPINPPLPPGTPAKVHLVRRGFGLLSWPPMVFPTANVEIALGKKPVPKVVVKPLELQIDPTAPVGGILIIQKTGETGFGNEQGTVKLGTRSLSVTSWKDDQIEAQIPDDSTLAAPGYSVLVTRADGVSGKGTVELKSDPPEPPPTPVPDLSNTSGNTAGSTSTGTTSTTATTGTSGTTGTTGTSAYQPSDGYSAMVEALKGNNVEELVKGAESARAANDPDAPALLVYAYSAAEQPASADAAVSLLKAAKLTNKNSIALRKLALAEYEKMSGHKDEAEAGYRSLGTFAHNNSVDLALIEAARTRHRAGH